MQMDKSSPESARGNLKLRAAVIVAAAVLTSVLMGTVAPAATVRRSNASLPCQTPGKLLAATDVAALSLRVVEESENNGYYGCVRGRRAQFIPGAPEDDQFAVFKQRPILRGRFVIVGAQRCAPGGSCSGGSRAVPLDGRAPTGIALDGPIDRRLVQVDGTNRGTVVELSSIVGGYELRSINRSTTVRTLDTGQIDPGSLTVTGDRAYWTTAGAARTATV